VYIYIYPPFCLKLKAFIRVELPLVLSETVDTWALGVLQDGFFFPVF